MKKTKQALIVHLIREVKMGMIKDGRRIIVTNK
jgi:hypothetical protein